MMDRDRWLQDYDGYLDEQYQQQIDLEKEAWEEEHNMQDYYEEKYHG